MYKQFNNLTQGASSLLEDEEVQPLLNPALHLNSKYSLEYPKAYSLDHKNLKILKKRKSKHLQGYSVIRRRAEIEGLDYPSTSKSPYLQGHTMCRRDTLTLLRVTAGLGRF